MTAKPDADYYYRKDSKRLRRECKECLLDRLLERQYGITRAEYHRIEKQQGGKCRICNRYPSGAIMRLAVDHCHGTGRVRGLLCGNCNTAIGLLHEDVDRLHAAIRYLQGEDIV